MKNTYSPEKIYETIKADWEKWANDIGAKKFLIGISGGKDSTVVAYLAAKIFGAENVIGVLLPMEYQSDIDDSYKVVNNLGIKNYTIDISGPVFGILNKLECHCIDISKDTRINLPCRMRMTTLYAVAQSLNAIVVNTSNLTEDMLGYATLWGDTCGSYAPIQGLTVTEVVALGDWLGVPRELSHKVPVDGLQELTDEQKLGMKYSDVDLLIRDNVGDDVFVERVCRMYLKNKFKIDMINLPGPKFKELPNYVVDRTRI